MKFDFRVMSGCVLLLVVAPFAARALEDRLQQSPEWAVSTAVAGEPSTPITNPVITRGQDESLVVWSDFRDERAWRLYGAWVGSDGGLKGNTFLIGANVALGASAVVAFNGSHYLVVWAGRDPEELTQWHIWGQRVSSSGSVVEDKPFVIASLEPGRKLGVAAAGGVWLVAYSGYGTDSTKGDIFGVRVSAEGKVLDASPFPISQSPSEEQQVAVGSNGTNLLVAWQDQTSGMHCVRVSPSGEVAATVTTLSPRPSYPANPHIASDGERFLVAWEDESDYLRTGLYGARVESSGSLVGTPFLIDSHIGDSSADVTFDGTRYLVVFRGTDPDETGETLYTYSVRAVRIGTDGALLDSPALRLSEQEKSNSAQPVAARDGTGFRVVWNKGPRLLTRTVDTNGLPAAATSQLNRPFNPQSAPAVAFDGHQFLLVWEDGRSGSTDIFATRMLPDGTSLDGVGFPISTHPAEQRHPAVTFDGTHFVVTWEDDRSGNKDIFAARVGKDGTVVQPEGLRVSDSPSNELKPAIASDGHGGVLVAWTEDSETAREIFGARLSGDTVLPLSGSISGRASVAFTATAHRNLSISQGGGNYLVVWADNRRNGSGSEIWGTMISTTTGSVEKPPFSVTSGLYNMEPVAAFDGSGFLVAWHVNNYYQVRARRIGANGALEGSELTLGSMGAAMTPPTLTFDGSDFVAAWENALQNNIVSVSVSPLGVLNGHERIDPMPSSRFDTYKGIALASGPAGSSLLAYTRYGSQPENAFRLSARMLTNSGPSTAPDAGTPPEQQPGETESGCGCTSSSGGLLFAGALLAWMGALRSRKPRG